jgi:hypothetical protein
MELVPKICPYLSVTPCIVDIIQAKRVRHECFSSIMRNELKILICKNESERRK